MTRTELQIRSLETDDIPAVVQITCRAWAGVTMAQAREEFAGRQIGNRPWQEHKADEIERMCHERPDQVFVAVVDGEVVGYSSLILNPDRTVGAVGNNAVAPDWRRRGIGRALVLRAIEEIRSHGVESLEVSTMHQDTGARALYAQLGFVEVGHSVHYAMPVGPDGSV